MLGRRRGRADPWTPLRSRHLLVVPTVVPVEDVDGLVRTWYPTTDLAGTGSADVGGARLRGPHELSTDDAVSADVPSPWTVVYDLEVEPGPRSEPPGPRPDGLHRVLPGGLPTGVEMAGLELLLALARRLGGGVRVVGSQEVLTPEPASAVDARVVSPTWVRVADVVTACAQHGPAAVEAAVAGDDSPAAVASAADGTPFDVRLDLGASGAVLVHAEVALAPEPAVAGEPFGAGPMAVYDLRWLPRDERWRLAEHLDEDAAAARERARVPLDEVARTLAEHGGGVVVDADGFLVDRYAM